MVREMSIMFKCVVRKCDLKRGLCKKKIYIFTDFWARKYRENIQNIYIHASQY